MNNYNGVRTIGFISVVLGTATLGVCGWIFFTHEYGGSTSLLKEDKMCFPNNISIADVHLPLSSSSFLRSPHLPLPLICYKFLLQFLEILVWNSFIAAVTSLFQVGISIYLLASTAPEAIKRAKYWTVLNIGLNPFSLVCFTSTITYPVPVELGGRDAVHILSNIKFLPSYYIILGMDIFLGFMMLISAMLMIKLENKFGYGIVANI